MKEMTNKFKYFIVPVVLLFVVFIFIRPSYANPEEKNRIVLASEQAIYADEDYNSWELEKSARWIDEDEAEITINVHSNPEPVEYTDIVLMVDLTDSHSANFLETYYTDYDFSGRIVTRTSIIGYDFDSYDIYLTEESTARTVYSKLYALEQMGYSHGTSNVFQALNKLNELLDGYSNMDERKIAVIFAGPPYPGINSSQEGAFDLVREMYPNTEYFYINTSENTERGFLNNKVDYVGNNIDLLLSANKIGNFVITDYLDLDYFDFEEVSYNGYKYIAVRCAIDYHAQKSIIGQTKASFLSHSSNYHCNDITEKEMDNVEYDEDTGKITWNLSNSIYSTSATLKVKVKLKDEYLNSDDSFTTNKSTRVETSMGDLDENIYSEDSPELKLNYKVQYDWNLPDECYMEPVIETHRAFSMVEIIKEAPSCNNYELKGWQSYNLSQQDICLDPEFYGLDYYDYLYNCGTRLNDNFTMPSNDVYLTALWGKVGIDKHFEGDEYGSYAIYSIEQKNLSNAAEVVDPTHLRYSTTTKVKLNSLDAYADYKVTAVNLTDYEKRVDVDSIENSNSNFTYEIIEDTVVLDPNSSKEFTLRIKYKDDLTEMPLEDTAEITLRYKFRNDGAMFKPGKEVNARMKELSGTGSSNYYADTRIEDIVRYEGIPNSSYLVNSNIVSMNTNEFPDPIYMWYDSSAKTIYWYSPAQKVYYNSNSSDFYYNLTKLEKISCLKDISSKHVTTMYEMFARVGNNNSNFKELDLGPLFDTSNVTTMYSMFNNMTNLETIYVPDTFVTTKVTSHTYMFTGCTKLVGGEGTAYTSSRTDKAYAHIDGGTSNPGYFTNRDRLYGAMFQTGQEVSVKMKKLVNSSATFSTQDTTITNIARYTGTPNSTYLTDTYKVSTDEYITPIYMWYDSTSTTIYWYSEAIDVYYNPNSSYFFLNLSAINSITCMNDISSEYVTNMSSMFYNTGYNSTTFTLDLGDKFDTSNVTNMAYMFNSTGYSSTSFTLDLGDKFDTSNVTKMNYMFYDTGYSSTVFTLDLGDSFDTSNVTNMENMFYYAGYSSTVFTLDLGNNFDTSNVTTMSSMFSNTGSRSTVFTLDLGDKFDTGNVTNMSNMFYQTGYSSTVFTLDLGDNFDTGNVTTMYNMFNSTGHNSTVFTLDLGDKFDTSNVINMYRMFDSIGYSNTSFTLDLGDKFDTGNVTNMSNMFDSTGRNSTVFTLDLGDKFDTSNVNDMYRMFDSTGYSSTVFTLDLGDKFDTSKVTNMSYMFSNSKYLKTIYAPTTFVTTAVTNSTDMFNGCTSLVGGQGTIYNSSYIDKTYAHIDGGTSNPGYFTARP